MNTGSDHLTEKDRLSIIILKVDVTGDVMNKHWFSNKTYNACYRFKTWIRTEYYNLRNRMRLNSTGVVYSDDIITSGKLIISNCGQITIGKGVAINSGSYPNPVGTSNTRIYTYDSNSKIFIGNNVGMSNVLLFAKEEISIGDDTMIGAETMIIDTDFHGVDIELIDGKYNREEEKSKPIHIGKNCFIGTGCKILKGVTVGDNSAVGAGSVVTKSIPSNQVWAGNPAIFLRDVNIK